MLASDEILVHVYINVTDSEYKSMGGHLLESSIVDAMAFVTIIEMKNGHDSEGCTRLDSLIPAS